MEHIKDFSRFANVYAQYNIIQKQVAKELIKKLKFKPKTIIDLGCGSGTLFNKIKWPLQNFLSIDLSINMIKNHPKSDIVHLKCENFDNEELFDKLNFKTYECILSSSSLQWSQNLELLFKNIANVNIPFALSLFTSNTFKALHEVAQTKSPIYSKENINSLALKYFNQKIEFKTYILKFEDKKEIFRYLKKSGVSHNKRQLTYKQTKLLMREYPYDYLEFEVAFIIKNSTMLATL